MKTEFKANIYKLFVALDETYSLSREILIEILMKDNSVIHCYEEKLVNRTTSINKFIYFGDSLYKKINDSPVIISETLKDMVLSENSDDRNLAEIMIQEIYNKTKEKK